MPKGLSPECFWPVALQTSEGSAGAFGLAFASSGQDAFNAMPASASQAAMRLRKRCAFTAPFLAQMRALFQPWTSGGSGILRSDMKGRLEDRRLLTGQGRFISDWNFPNQVYAAFLRSDRAHAEIVSVDASAALQAPGVLLVLTGRDVAEAGYKSIPTNLGVKDRFGEPLKKPPRPVLAQGKVRHVGECVACVVAESR